MNYMRQLVSNIFLYEHSFVQLIINIQYIIKICGNTKNYNNNYHDITIGKFVLKRY